MKFLRICAYIVTPFLVVVLSTYLTISILLKKDDTTLCPDLRGKSIEQAKKLVEKQGLTLNVVRYERRNDIPLNHVTVQKPDANITIRKGRVVNVLVSQGPDMTKVPNLIGQTIEDATMELEVVNLGIARTILVPCGKPGQIFAQLPVGGEEIVEGQKVTMFVGTEPRRYYMMPGLADEDLSSVAIELEEKRIRYRLSYTVRDSLVSARRTIVSSPKPRVIFSSDEEIALAISYGG